MVGHLDVPGLTDPGVPASISPAAMTLLRTGTGYGAPPFDGPIFTDDLSGMAAITARMSIADAVEAALTRGRRQRAVDHQRRGAAGTRPSGTVGLEWQTARRPGRHFRTADGALQGRSAGLLIVPGDCAANERG